MIKNKLSLTTLTRIDGNCTLKQLNGSAVHTPAQQRMTFSQYHETQISLPTQDVGNNLHTFAKGIFVPIEGFCGNLT